MTKHNIKIQVLNNNTETFLSVSRELFVASRDFKWENGEDKFYFQSASNAGKWKEIFKNVTDINIT